MILDSDEGSTVFIFTFIIKRFVASDRFRFYCENDVYFKFNKMKSKTGRPHTDQQLLSGWTHTHCHLTAAHLLHT